MLYAGSCSGNFYALDKRTGKLRWSYNIHQDGDQTSFHGDPLIAGRLVVIGTDIGKQGHIYAFDRATGKVLWKYLVTTGCKGDYGVTTNIVRKRGAIYAVAQGDVLLCLDLATGRVRWRFASHFDRSKFEWANSPALRGNLVFFDGHDGVVYALAAASGKLIWKTDLHSPVTTSPVVIGNSVYAGTSGHLYRLRLKDGKELGSIAFVGVPWRNVTVARDMLFTMPDIAAKEQEDLLALNVAAQRVQWAVKAPTGKGGWALWNTAWPYLWHREVLASDHGHLYAYRQGDGSLAWSHGFPGQSVRGIGVTPKVLYIGTVHGMIYAFVPPQSRF